MRFPAIFIMIFSLFISGCNGLQNREQTTNTNTVEREDAATSQPVRWQDSIQLNAGNPWQMNRETTEGMGRISERLRNDEAGTVEEYRELGNELQRERENLDRSRTPNNPSDDNLNLYLEPLDEKIRQLQEVESVEEGDRLKSELEQHLHAYSDYFV